MSIPSSVLAAGTARDVSPDIYPGVVAYIAIAGVVLLLFCAWFRPSGCPCRPISSTR